MQKLGLYLYMTTFQPTLAGNIVVLRIAQKASQNHYSLQEWYRQAVARKPQEIGSATSEASIWYCANA
ncbi:hypothetical protein [Hymenobacter sp.]|jgi:hypothetical protein|uniref:hypothetical protein n=1 Tax=Hymenobacter sp. TaxID=1898978 RepID=UPI002ED981BB